MVDVNRYIFYPFYNQLDKTLRDDITLIKPLISEDNARQEEVGNIKTTLKSHSHPPNPPPTKIDPQEMIHDEVLECQERDKRLNSVIVRGLRNDPLELQNNYSSNILQY